MKTKEALNTLKEEVETQNKKLVELSEEELAQVSGGLVPDFDYEPGLEPVVIETGATELTVGT